MKMSEINLQQYNAGVMKTPTQTLSLKISVSLWGNTVKV